MLKLYVHDGHAAVKRPEKELKAFEKVFLRPGQTKIVILALPVESFKYYDEGKKQWVLAPGKFDLLVGSSSYDIRQTGTVYL